MSSSEDGWEVDVHASKEDDFDFQSYWQLFFS